MIENKRKLQNANPMPNIRAWSERKIIAYKNHWLSGLILRQDWEMNGYREIINKQMIHGREPRNGKQMTSPWPMKKNHIMSYGRILHQTHSIPNPWYDYVIIIETTLWSILILSWPIHFQKCIRIIRLEIGISFSNLLSSIRQLFMRFLLTLTAKEFKY